MTDLIIDANSLWARAYFAAHREEHLRELEGAFESPGSAAVVATRMVLNILNPFGSKLGQKIDRLLFCWDGSPKREKRRPTPKPESYEPELARFIPVMHDLFGAANATPSDHEADDAVATAVYRSQADKVFVASADKDLQQLQGGNVEFYDLRDGMVKSRMSILQRWQVKRPSQICIALAILGDPGDNISGIHGWGPKKVERLFQKVTPDMDLEHALEVIEAQIPHDKLMEFRESLDLTVLDPDVPDVPDPAPLKFAPLEVLHQHHLREAVGTYLQVRQAYEGEMTDADMDKLIDS
jgi:5'-3' exonuclease